ncbi:dTDP-4-dehydrorhamnose reductase [Cellulosilyticum ruminicola]|uniref:dTDP-4-dehydrorhamnose reductase n=1 Tax=Cellulosilyticum ruminicola TaxID=425254 RepID=UPI0006D014E6|nr:dTDP-4-dehydrorhamnose reductase [Cellulosilyticum ruminicola]
MKNVSKVWIVGASGQIGKALNSILDRCEMEILNTDIDDVDITNAEEVMKFADRNRPDVIINCGALTSIDECEADLQKAYKVNAIGARNVSIATKRVHAKLIHLSTDDVFDGKSTKPYSEFDQPIPSLVYGKSKLAGEQFVKDFADRYFIIRSNWVYGKGENFIQDLLALAKQKDVIHISNEAFGNPTSAKALGQFIIKLMQSNEYGVYHVTCEGTCSRKEFAEEIIRLSGLNTKIVAVTNDEDEVVSKRPAYTVLDNLMRHLLENMKMPHWKEALAEYMKII